MAYHEVICPHCHGTSVNKRGFSAVGTQRYWCKTCQQTFQLHYRYNACKPGMKDHILDQTMNGSGVRDIGRSSQVSTGTVLSTIRAIKEGLVQVNQAFLERILAKNPGCEVEIFCACELDEQWSFIQNKGEQRWLWHAVDRTTNTVLAYVLGPRTDAVFEELYALLKPFQVTHYYTDGWGAYHRILPSDKHTVTKRETQNIERKHLTFRTRIKRLARKTICFSKSATLHDAVLGLFINRYEFGRTVTA
jgi:IS1 family transposase/transposase-like protein